MTLLAGNSSSSVKQEVREMEMRHRWTTNEGATDCGATTKGDGAKGDGAKGTTDCGELSLFVVHGWSYSHEC